jgi:hypothetical protein
MVGTDNQDLSILAKGVATDIAIDCRRLVVAAASKRIRARKTGRASLVVVAIAVVDSKEVTPPIAETQMLPTLRVCSPTARKWE